ncbi:two-component sensor histidine kinase [Nonomuraea sp. NN258]|nr:two-component sensor histidine kinase [Nonomuraea antri]
MAGFAGVYVAAGAVGAVAVFGLQCLFAFLRRTGPVLALLGAAAYAVTLGGGSVGLLGFLGGSLLVTRWWGLMPAVALSAAVIDHARRADPAGTLDATISTVLISLVVYGLIRLVERVDELHATRLALAAAAVGEERLRIAAELNDGLGRGLAAIIAGARTSLADPARAADVLGEVVATARGSLADARAAAANYRAMSLTPELTTARAMLDAAGVAVEVRAGHGEPLGPAGALLAAVLREAVTDVVRRGEARLCLIETDEPGATVTLRVTDDGRRTADGEGLSNLAQQVESGGGTLRSGLSPDGRHWIEAALPRPATRAAGPAPARARTLPDVSVVLLAAVLLGFSVKALLQLPPSHLWPAAVVLTVIVVMQLRAVSGRHMAALSVMAVLTYAPIPFFGAAWLGVPGFLAGPILLAFRRRVSVPLVAAVLASVAAVSWRLGLPLSVGVNYTLSALVTGLVMHGLLRLAAIVAELRAARESLARSAVVEERLRAARDLHDLLGHSLAAILLTCELARRLPEPRAQLAEIVAMAERAEHDLRSVSGEQRDLSLAAEADSAASTLATARVEVSVSLAHPPLPPEVETVLSAVLREAVTNVLRHSSARRCVISTEADGRSVRLRVRNDGARATGSRRGSSGIGNLTTRLATLDGRLTTGFDDGWFLLDAAVPYPGLDPARLGGDAHGVGAVAGV